MSHSRLHPDTGQELFRGERVFDIIFRGQHASVILPGWYAADDLDGSSGIHTGEDLEPLDSWMREVKSEQMDAPRNKSRLREPGAEACFDGNQLADFMSNEIQRAAGGLNGRRKENADG